MNALARPQICIYCGNNVRKVRRGKGEHIIPKIIGGALAIKNVCQSCNNHFSDIDRELCCRSPLSIIASQELDAHIWQVWDVDHKSNNLLLEARPNWIAKSLVLYPQMLFEKHRSYIQGDLEEINTFGNEDYDRVLIKTVLEAFRRYKSGQRGWLHFEHIELNKELSSNYRFPPRIFSRHSIREIANRLIQRKQTSYVLRYVTDADRRIALNALDNWNPTIRRNTIETGRGSYRPWMRCFYQMDKTLRALEKIAINILAHICQNTPVNKTSFEHIIKVIMGQRLLTLQMWQRNGFVYPPDIDQIKCPNGGHSFRLLHTSGEWHVVSSFFGGRICSFTVFPGPNDEAWCTANIQAPIGKRNWTITTSTILQPLHFHCGWKDMSKIIPSVEMVNTRSESHAEYGE